VYNFIIFIIFIIYLYKMYNNLVVTILAAGMGKRMNSDIPKVLHEVNGVPMVVKIINQVKLLKPKLIIIVVGKYMNLIRHTLNNYDSLSDCNYIFVVQSSPHGTGDAVKCTLPILHEDEDVYNFNLILNGDTPLLSINTLRSVCDNFIYNNKDIQITCIKLDNPSGNGRIIIDNNGVFQQIIEDKDCNEEQLQIQLINVGIYVCSIDVLFKYIPLIDNNNKQNEFYLTDIVKLYSANENKEIGLFELPSDRALEVSNVNTIDQLNQLNQLNNQTRPMN
jgi:UDP-N-acetylglucosamine diphosphorylase/glucosamine-1-phosphate N-acetyltransferase